MAEKDITEKMLADYNDVFADIVNVLLFNGEGTINEDDLEPTQVKSMYKADGQIHEQERDILKKYRGKNIQLAMIGLENQTSPEKYMPLRVLSYDGATYRSQLLANKKNEIIPTVTLVLYFGDRPWNYGKSLYEVMDIADEWKPFVSDYHMNLFEIAFLSEEQVSMFKSDFRVVADYFVQMRTNGKYKPSAQVIRHVDEVLKLLEVFTGDAKFGDIVIPQDLTGGVSMVSVLSECENRGIAKGMVKGMAKGKVAVYYFEYNLTAVEIAEKLHIPISEVEDIIFELEEANEY